MSLCRNDNASDGTLVTVSKPVPNTSYSHSMARVPEPRAPRTFPGGEQQHSLDELHPRAGRCRANPTRTGSAQVQAAGDGEDSRPNKTPGQAACFGPALWVKLTLVHRAGQTRASLGRDARLATGGGVATMRPCVFHP